MQLKIKIKLTKKFLDEMFVVSLTFSWDNPIEIDGKNDKRFKYCEYGNKSHHQQNRLIEAYRALSSTLSKCEKINNDKLGKSQQTLLERRINALKMALELIKNEQENL